MGYAHLALIAGGTIGAALMAAVQINKMQDRLDERIDPPTAFGVMMLALAVVFAIMRPM